MCDQRKKIRQSISYPREKTFDYLYEEIYESKLYQVDLPDAPNIIDGGAYIGLSTRFFVDKYPKASITCFEPNPHAFKHLKQTFGSADRVDLYKKALGAEHGCDEIIVEANKADTLMASLYSERLPNHISRETFEVETIPLSSVVEDTIDLLKLDVEGSEVTILSELQEQQGLNCIDQAIIEVHEPLDKSDRTLTIKNLFPESYEARVLSKTTSPRGENRDVVLHIESSEKADMSIK